MRIFLGVQVEEKEKETKEHIYSRGILPALTASITVFCSLSRFLFPCVDDEQACEMNMTYMKAQ
jgi:hypothetical protein